MIRVHVICEGATEEMFVNELLVPSFAIKGVFLSPSKIGRPGHKGGNVNFPRLFKDVNERLLRDKKCYCTTLLDYYGLPSDFPGKVESNVNITTQEKFQKIQNALSTEMTRLLGDEANRFIPYVQMHEFEGVIFSAPEILAQSLQRSALANNFKTIRKNFATPEDINDSPVTAPSKRIEKLFPGYDKPIHPLLAARDMGLETIRRECPLFDGWIKRLEALAKDAVE